MKMTSFLHIPVFILCLNQLHGQPFSSFDLGPRFADYGPPTDSAAGFDSFPRSYSSSSLGPPYQLDRRGRPNFRDRSLDPYDGIVARGSRTRLEDRFDPLERSRPRVAYTDPYQPADRRFSPSYRGDSLSSGDRTDFRDPYITSDRHASRGPAVDQSAVFRSHGSPRRMRDRYEPIDRLGNSRQMLNEFNSYERRQDLPRYRDFPHDFAQDFDSRRSMTIDPWTGERIYRPTWESSLSADGSMRRRGYRRFEPHLNTGKISERIDRSMTRRPVDRIAGRKFTQTTVRDQRIYDNLPSTEIRNSRGMINDPFKTDLISSRRSSTSNRQNRRKGRRLGVLRKKDNGEKRKSRNKKSGQDSVTKISTRDSNTQIQSSKEKGGKDVTAKNGHELVGPSGADKSVSEKKSPSKRKKNPQPDLPSDKKRVSNIGNNNIVNKPKEKAKVDKQTVTVKPEIGARHTTEKPILVNLPNGIHESFAGIAIIDLSPFGVEATSLSNKNEAKTGQATPNNIEYSTLAQAITSNFDYILSNATNSWNASTNATHNTGDKSNVMSTPDFEVIFLNVNDSSLSAEIKTLLSNNSQEIIAILNEAPSHNTPHPQGSTEPPGTTSKKGLERANGPGYKDYIKYMFPSNKYALAATLGLGRHRVPGRASPSAAFTPLSDSNMANTMRATLGLQGPFPNNINGNFITPDLMLQNNFMEGLF